MNSERYLTPIERLVRRRAVVRARRLRPRALRAQLTGMERLAHRRALMRARGLKARALNGEVSWEPFANDDEALAFADAMSDDVFATMPPWEGDC